MTSKDLLAQLSEAAARMFPSVAAAARVAQLERKNRELYELLREVEEDSRRSKSAYMNLLMQKDAEIARLHAEMQRMADNSPFQYFPQVVWSKS